MTSTVIELYPESGVTRSLSGLYLDQLAGIDTAGDEVFVYSNYVTSLDGRIALPGKGKTHQVPPAIANPRDWRLFQELAAQADLLITSGRYFRQAADAEAQAELPVGSSDEFTDLRDWRLQQGLKPQPDIAIFSASLDIPPKSLAHYRDRKLHLFTGSDHSPAQVERLGEFASVNIIKCGNGRGVDATLVKGCLAALGYRRVYAIAGPSVLHTLASGKALDRLYLTTAHRLLGGTEFDTIAWGPQLDDPTDMPLRALYLDTAAPQGAGQTLAVYGAR